MTENAETINRTSAASAGKRRARFLLTNSFRRTGKNLEYLRLPRCSRKKPEFHGGALSDYESYWSGYVSPGGTRQQVNGRTRVVGL